MGSCYELPSWLRHYRTRRFSHYLKHPGFFLVLVFVSDGSTERGFEPDSKVICAIDSGAKISISPCVISTEGGWRLGKKLGG